MGLPEWPSARSPKPYMNSRRVIPFLRKRPHRFFGLLSMSTKGPTFTFRGHHMSDRYGITHDGYEFKVSQIAG